MKNKIRVFVMLMFIGISGINAQGFQKRTVEERVKQSVDKVNDSLQLVAAQLPDVNAAFAQYYMAQDQLREGLAPGARPERAAIEKLIDIRDGKLKVILTEAQFTKFKELDAAMRQRGRQRPPGQ